jgi:subtilisin family serine protease
MSHHAYQSAWNLSLTWAVNHWDRGRRNGRSARRHSRSRTIGLEIDYLETRTLLSVSAVKAPMPSSASATTQESLNVQFEPGSAGALLQLASLITAEGVTLQATTVAGLYVLQGPVVDMGQLAHELSANPAVAYVDPVQTVQTLTVPNNPDYLNGDEWQLNGTWGINVPKAWNVTTGSNEVIVADTDTGIAYNVPSLYDNVWINQAEIPSTVLLNLTDVYHNGVITFTDLNAVVNGVKVNQGPGKIKDSNSDGIITATDLLAPASIGGWADGSTQDGDTTTPDDLIGWNFAAIGTSTPNGTNNPIDQNGHGTFTAGEIGAVGNNGIGVVGVEWNAQIMPVQFMNSSGSGTDTAAAEAIEYAVNHGAKVINASWGGSGVDATIAAAIQYADQAGVIVVAAAGNNGTDDDNSSTWFSPASYSVDYPNLISVAATDSNGDLASWSDYGITSVQLAAPGVNVYGAENNGTYGTDSGTSMAAPLVTGTIALVEAAHPTWSTSQVIDAVLDTTTPDPNLVGKVTTGGIVNATAAVANTDGPCVVSASPDGSVNSSSGLSSVSLKFNEEINPAIFTPSQVTLTGPAGTISAVTITPVSGSNDHEFTIAFPTQTAAGTYGLKVGPDIQDWYGNDMNQNRNGVNGESSDAFVATIRQTAPGSSDLLSITGIPSAVTAGTSKTFTVTALRSSGGTDTGYVGTIEFSSTDSQAILPSSYTFIAGNDGTFTFHVTFKTAGIQAITATNAANAAIIGTEDNIIVQAAAASSLKITGFATTEIAGTPEMFTVTADDAYGNVATGYTGTMRFTSSDSQANLPANYTVSPEQQGTFTALATFWTPGAESITVTDVTTPSITGSTSTSVSAATTATFIKQDTTTGGNWTGKYGAVGYNVINSGSSYPSSVTVAPANELSYTWTTTTTSVQALKDAPSNGTGRIAACWYSATSFTVDVDFTDGQMHDIELYLLEFNGANKRSEQIQLSNAANSTVLSTVTASSFSNGIYYNWEVSGNILITFTRVTGPNAILNGLFIDPPSTSASFLGTDSTTQGNWTGKYGAVGYNVINSGSSYPSAVTVAPANELSYTWTATTTSVQALKDAPSNGTGRIAACWYSATSFTVDLDFTDGQMHNIELYLLDFNGGNTRSEQIQLSNAANSTVLSTVTASSFSNGIYYNWEVSGNILITFTRKTGPNAILNGLFIDPSTVLNNVNMKALLVTGNETRLSGILGPDNLNTLNFAGSDSQAVPAIGTITFTADPVVPISLVPVGTVETRLMRVTQDSRNKPLG